MVKALYMVLFLLPLVIMGQDTLPNKKEPIYISKTLTVYPGEVYLDSVKINLQKTFIDPKNIRETKVFKGQSAKNISGAIGATLITRKKKGEIVSLKVFAATTRANSKNDTITIVVNEQLITEPDNYFIELSSIKKISILNYEKNEIVPDRPTTMLITTKSYKKKKK